MSKKQDLLTRLGAEIAEFTISNRGKEPAEYAEKLRQLQMLLNAVEYDPKLTPAQADLLYDKGVTLEDISAKMQGYHLNQDTAASFFHGVEWYADSLYANHRLTELWTRLVKENDAYLDGIRKLPADEIIEKAWEISLFADIIETFSHLDHTDLDSKEADALLTIKHPLKALAAGWPTYDSEDVSDCLVNLASDRQDELLEERGSQTRNADILEYRRNYLAYEDQTQKNPLAERLEALKDKIENDYTAIKKSSATETEQFRLEEARAAYYAHHHTPVDVEVLLTYAHPLREIMAHAVRHSTDFSSAVISVIGAREAELNGYLMRLGQMPEFLQGPLKEFSRRCEAAQAYCPQEPLELDEAVDYESEQE